MKERLYNDRVINDRKQSSSSSTYQGQGRNSGYQGKPSNYNSNYKRDSSPNTRSYSSYNRDDRTPVTYPDPETHTKEFISMIEAMAVDVMNASPSVNLIVTADLSKEENGIVAMRVHGERLNDVKPSEEPGVMFYYIEDRNIVNPKNPRPIKQYPAMIFIMNQFTGKVLFTKFGPYCIDQAEKYVRRIMEKEVSFVTKENDRIRNERKKAAAALVDVD